MKSYIGDITRLYFQTAVNGKHPISEIDGAILEQLVQAVVNLRNEDLSLILGQYKKIDDEDVLEALIEFNQRVTSQVSIDEMGVQWIQIQSGLYQVKYLYSIESKNMYDSKQQRWTGAIVLNNTDSGTTVYGNTVIVFNSIAERDRELKQIKARLTLCNISFI